MRSLRRALVDGGLASTMRDVSRRGEVSSVLSAPCIMYPCCCTPRMGVLAPLTGAYPHGITSWASFVLFLLRSRMMRKPSIAKRRIPSKPRTIPMMAPVGRLELAGIGEDTGVDDVLGSFVADEEGVGPAGLAPLHKGGGSISGCSSGYSGLALTGGG